MAVAAGPTLFLLAGEPSADVLGARLMAALRERTGGAARFAGVGGPRMVEQGLDSLYPMDDLAVMGFFEVLPSLPLILRRLRETAAAVERLRPDALVTIDSPGFSFRLHGRLAAAASRQARAAASGGDGPTPPPPPGPLRVHYVAPQVWAWLPHRAKRLAALLDHLLVLLPFEPPFFEGHGLPCTFVGHPVVEEAQQDTADAAAFRARHGLAEGAPVICLLPGSRRSEVGQHLPVLGAALPLLARRLPGLRAVLPTVPGLAAHVRAAVAGWPVPPAAVIDDRRERFAAYAASSVAVAASGTVGLEVALAGLPLVTIYRTKPLTALVARRLIRVPHVNLINLVLGRPVIPELLQEACRPERIADAASTLIEDAGARDRQRAAMAEATAMLGRGGEPPSLRAADALLGALAARAGRREPHHHHDHHQRERRAS